MCLAPGVQPRDRFTVYSSLKVLDAGLPRDFPASVLVVLHTAPNGPGILPEIPERAGPLPAANARDREQLRPGHIYVAPPDNHLLVGRGGYTRVKQGPKENRFRPTINPLFRSAAWPRWPRKRGRLCAARSAPSRRT